ncbi:MAG TPA: molybdopterin-dependent oxidoreductase [Patescibacteria group bacterium]|nr:molybdopterin-dependent oxidoreductase [Patescibacteria group bacterium]
MKRTVRTMCPMNCHPTLCGMLVEVQDGRVTRVTGDPDNPDSRGFLCVRGQAAPEILDNPRRLLHPMLRATRGGPWRRASWDEALDLIVRRMRAAGREAVATWPGHGIFANNYGTRIHSHLLRRFSNIYGCQWWSPAIICWALGGFGLGITGLLEPNTKEDMGANANLILLWGANLASQPNTGRHLAAAKRRGARIVTIDVRETEAAAQSDETVLIRPGTDAALALAMLHVLVAEGLVDRDFVARHTIGFPRLAAHLGAHTPAWAAGITGIAAERIVDLARRYASTRPAMIVVGGSSMHKASNGWHAARAIACLPALTGQVGIAGGGLGPRHGASLRGQVLGSIVALDRRPPGDDVPNQMPRITESLVSGRVRVLLLFGTDMLSSFADAHRVAEGLARQDLVVCYDLFENDTARRFADVLLPSTSWLEELGCKATNTHVYLMPQVLPAPGETRSMPWLLRALAERLGLDDFFPWKDDAELVDAMIDVPATRHATVAALTTEGGIRAMNVSHVGHPDLTFPTPSGKLELFSELAVSHGLPGLPVYEAPADSPYPLTLRQGRTLTAFHGFYDHGQALPSLAKADPEPVLWISPADAAARGVADGAMITLANARGEMQARAYVTSKIPAGTVWMRDGWSGLNTLTSGDAVLPDGAVEVLGFAAGQAAFDARVEVTPLG